MSSDRKILTASPGKKQDYINSLPDEVLRMIFDRLDLKNVKNASATCHRWHSIIFLSGYINRFVFKIELTSSFCNTSVGQMQMTELKVMVGKSQRFYRNIYWTIAEGLKVSEFSSVWEAIQPKVTKHLRSLKLSYVNSSKFLPLIAYWLPLMSKLQSLTLKDRKRDCGTQDVIPTLRSDSLKHLKINCWVKYRLDMPHLQSYDGTLSSMYLPDDSREAVALSSLSDLMVFMHGEYTSPHSIPMLRSFFRQTRLEKITWDSTLSKEIFSLICATCTTLKEFYLEPGDSIVNDLNSLAKLPNLRVLEISACSIDIDVSEVNQLEELQLSFLRNVVKVPSSIKKLQVRVTTDNELSMSHTILTSGTHLTELVVEIDKLEDHLKGHAPLDIIQTLPHLKYLKMLKFINGRFKRSSFLCMDAPLDTLQQLHFEESYVSSKHFVGLKKKFPNLKKLSFTKFGCSIECYESPSSSVFFAESDEDD